MATVVAEFGQSKEKTTFNGSSEDDIAYAKSFWQSVQLQPPMESRLVSSDIKQRLKVAPAGGQGVNLTYRPYEEPPQLTNHLAKAEALQKQEELHKLERLSLFREEDLELLEKHREIRKQKESISNHRGLRRPQPFQLSDDSDKEDDNVEESIKELDSFDKRLGQKNDSDSD